MAVLFPDPESPVIMNVVKFFTLHHQKQLKFFILLFNNV